MWSSYIQLKLGHGYFKSYLKRVPAHYDDDKCDCNNSSIQSPAHLLLECSKYAPDQSILKNKLNLQFLTLKDWLCSKEGFTLLFEYLKSTGIITRNWLS